MCKSFLCQLALDSESAQQRYFYFSDDKKKKTFLTNNALGVDWHGNPAITQHPVQVFNNLQTGTETLESQSIQPKRLIPLLFHPEQEILQWQL